MTNEEISKLLYDVADMLELADVIHFEVIAYQSAARTVEHYNIELEDIYKKEGLAGLQNIKGIGKTISQNIEEYITTGKSSKKAYLLEKIPKMLIEINRIPSVGPKTAKKLFAILKPKNMTDFTKKIKQERYQKELAKISLKEKTISNILRGVKVSKELSKRTPIAIAWPIAQYFLNEIKDTPGVLQADVVGSLRRMRETVGDIDIIACVATHKESEVDPRVEVINHFVKAKEVSEVINHGVTKATILTHENIQIDFEILPQSEYGSLLQHFTGSKEHNVELRTYSLKQNLSISEHGITPTNSKGEKQKDKIIKCDNEEKVYKTLGLKWITPELREGRGEVEAAKRNKLPKLIELKDIKGDLQMHTKASDGKATLEDMARAAEKLGYEYIGITDHSNGLGVTGGFDDKTIHLQNKKIDELNLKLQQEKSKLTVLKSIEVNIKADGSLDMSDKALKTLDVVVASIHSSFNQSLEATTERYLKAIHNPNVHIIAHPTGRIIGRRPEIKVDWDQVFTACLETGTVLEINAALERLDLPDRLALEAGRRGVKLVISTDAHSPEGLDAMQFGIFQARRAWLQKTQILNTLNKEDFLNNLKTA